jgi:hypothetical protein
LALGPGADLSAGKHIYASKSGLYFSLGLWFILTFSICIVMPKAVAISECLCEYSSQGLATVAPQHIAPYNLPTSRNLVRIDQRIIIAFRECCGLVLDMLIVVLLMLLPSNFVYGLDVP